VALADDIAALIVTPAVGGASFLSDQAVLHAAAKSHETRTAANTTAVAAAVKTVNSTAPDGSGNVVVSGGGSVSAATTTALGTVQLAGDLFGPATAPSIFATVQTGVRIARTFTGAGAPPTTIAGAVAGDIYVNTAATPPTVYDITGA
jgi:hypothetical protein